MIFAPAIIPTDEAHLKEMLLKIREVASDIQIDIVDGVYASPASWPYIHKEHESLKRLAENGGSLPMTGEFIYEVDLMVEEPEAIAGTFIALGATRIVLHFGSARDIAGTIKHLGEKFGYAHDFAPSLLSIGVALSIDTPISVLKSLVESIDFVQLMGIAHIGVQGQPFDGRVVERLKEIKKLYPELPVQIDGGVSLETAPQLFEAGADRLIEGSKFWLSNNYQGTIEAFNALAERYGIYS